MTAWKEKIQSIIAQEDLNVSEIKSQLKDLVIEEKTVLKFKKLHEVQEKMQRWMPGNKENTILIGFQDMDKVLGGFAKGEITVIAGRPGMGSSRMLHHIILHCAEKHRCLLINLQNAAEKTWFDLLSYQLNIDQNQLTREDEREEIFTKAFRQKHAHKIANISIGERFSLERDEFEKQLRSYIIEHQIEVLGIDKIQLLGILKEFKHRNHELSQVMLMLKRVAEELNVCIFMISALSRTVERRAIKVPVMQDLSDSNAIEEYADKVLLLYRPEYYSINDDLNPEDENMMEVHVAKNRYGSCEIFSLYFLPVLKDRHYSQSFNAFHFEEKRLDEIFDIIRKGVEKNIQEDDEPVF